MQNIDHLTELIEEAASTVNMIGPDDLSEIENLLQIFDEIKNALDSVECSSEIVNKASGETSGSLELLQKLLHNDIEQTGKSIEIISKTITTLQEVIDQINHGKLILDSESKEKDSEDVSKDSPATECGMEISKDDIPIVLDFIAESFEHIESAEAGLLELENKPDDKDTINLIFRGFHTIKGMAGFLNLTDIGSLAHSAENLLGLAREGRIILSGNTTDIVFESIDMMKKMMNVLKESIEAGQPVPPQRNLSEFLKKLKTFIEAEPQELKNDNTESKEDKPAEKPDSKNDKYLENVLEPGDQVKEDKTVHKKEAISGDEKIKVSTTRLDNLINMVGELVIAQLMVSEEVSNNLSVNQRLNYKVASQSKLVRELQELSMSMRMIPISGVFQKMARLVRDLSHKTGKKINFVTSGDDTELDRSIVDKISDPLVHMVRNAIDHGIESADERAKSGKSKEGLLELRAFHQAGNIVIEIQDDGKGLDKECILQKAIANGIIDSNHELTDEEVFKLIFHAGLSTAQKVTSISGRGVGMDVVRKNIEFINGKIEIQSVPGHGTTFTIRMPLTLAIIDGQIVKVGKERYIIPISSVINSFRPDKSQISTIQNNGEVVLVRGELIPLVRLYKLFGVTPMSNEPSESLLIIVEKDSHKYCLLVDEVQEQQQVVIKSLDLGHGKVKGISGAAIMGDGRVSLILDIPGLIELSNN